MQSYSEDWAKQSPYDKYFDFIAPGADRYSILTERIDTLGLSSTVISIAGNRHVFIFPPGQKSLREAKGVFPFKGKNPFLLSAHYDRVEGSPGANDNSIAVFHLLKAAAILAREKIDDWIIVFTDKEEITEGESFQDQGSYSMAEKLKSWGLEKANIFNFDACGTGSVFVFSCTGDLILKDSERENIQKVHKRISLLRDHALKKAYMIRLDKVLLLPTPFSDDAGFLRAGLAAQTITMLPAEEAAAYEALIKSRSDFANLLISGQLKEERALLPQTWLNLNNNSDTADKLTPQYFAKVVEFMVELCR